MVCLTTPHWVTKQRLTSSRYPDLRPNGSATDATMIKASAKFIAVNWSSASATVAILNLDQPGKRKGLLHHCISASEVRDNHTSSLSSNIGLAEPFLIHAHSGQLSDFEFNPFDDALLATGADDAHVKLWRIPQEGLTANMSSPQADLSGHKKSADVIAFHPSASNVMATGSADKTVKLWDLEKAQEKATIEVFGDSVQGIAWNYDGSLIAVTSKDKKVRIIDPRANTVLTVCIIAPVCSFSYFFSIKNRKVMDMWA